MSKTHPVFIARSWIIRNNIEIHRALLNRDYYTARRLQKESKEIKEAVLHKYDVIIDY